jgi:hypothetical protein
MMTRGIGEEERVERGFGTKYWFEEYSSCEVC